MLLAAIPRVRVRFPEAVFVFVGGDESSVA